MIDISMQWVEIICITEELAPYIAFLFHHQWLCRYPYPLEVIHGDDTEFSTKFQELLDSYSITS